MSAPLIVVLPTTDGKAAAMAIPSSHSRSECIMSGLRPQLLGTAIATFPAQVLYKNTTPDRRQNMFDDQKYAGGILAGGVILSVVVFTNT